MWTIIKNSLFIRLVLLPALIIFILALLLVGSKDYAFIVSLSTALVSWSNSQILSSLSFVRSEASKNRDTISQYIEKLFDDMELLFSDRALKRDKLETILSSRVSILELRIQHIEKRTEMKLLNTQHLAILRDKPLDFLTSNDYKIQLTEMKFNYLENIECNYSEWFRSKTSLIDPFV